MAEPDAYQWLTDWISENPPERISDRSAIAAQAELCRTEAVEDGVALNDLYAACGGDIEFYLRKHLTR